jgi:hypothetical protein
MIRLVSSVGCVDAGELPVNTKVEQVVVLEFFHKSFFLERCFDIPGLLQGLHVPAPAGMRDWRLERSLIASGVRFSMFSST